MYGTKEYNMRKKKSEELFRTKVLVNSKTL